MAANPNVLGLAADLAAGRTTSRALVETALARIGDPAGEGARTFTRVYADQARAAADAQDQLRKAGYVASPLAGLPVSIKDLTDVAGVRTTYGSPLFADHVPARSHPLVERIERKGGIVMGKSNTPEFGAGGSTFNEVFGRTRNPWNTALTSGGSTGGGAVSLATGEVWLAQGSDHGGSLRGPGSHCSVVGLRPSPGRDVDIDGALGRIAQQVALQGLALDRHPADRPGRADEPAHLKRLLLASFGGPHNRVEQSMPHHRRGKAWGRRSAGPNAVG